VRSTLTSCVFTAPGVSNLHALQSVGDTSSFVVAGNSWLSEEDNWDSHLHQYTEAKDLSRSLQLTAAIDAHTFRKSLLNQALPIINQEVDAWRSRQRGLLIDQVVDILTDPSSDTTGKVISTAAHGLDDHVHKWVDAKRSEIQNFTQTHIVNEACENMVDLWAAKAVIHRIDACRQELDAQTDAFFDTKGIETCRLNRLAELEALAAEHIVSEELRLQEMVSSRIVGLKHDAKVRLHDADDDLNSRALTSAIRSGKPSKQSPISSRTRSKKASKRRGALDLSSQPSADSKTPMTTDDDAPASPVASEVCHSSPAEPTPWALSFSRPQSPPPPSPRPTSTTPTGPPPPKPVNPTPPLEPASELTMVLAAISNMKSSLSAEILKVMSEMTHLSLTHPTSSRPPNPLKTMDIFLFLPLLTITSLSVPIPKKVTTPSIRP
jgi:hypothetical protein